MKEGWYRWEGMEGKGEEEWVRGEEERGRRRRGLLLVANV